MMKARVHANHTSVALAACFASIAGLAVLTCAPAQGADPATLDWSKIPIKNVTLFYPGQSTFDWLRTPDHKRGNLKVLAGDPCVACHEGEEEDLGKKIVSGKRLEPTPIAGKNGSLALAVQAAYDKDFLYFRFQWKTQMSREGRMHDFMRYDGKKWAFMGGPRSEEHVRGGKEPPLYEDRFTVMLDDGKVPMFAEQGCWLTCHDSMPDQPKEAASEQVKAHPYLGQKLKDNEVKKYLPASRTDKEASWDKVKSPDEIAKLKAEGQFVDLWQWRTARSSAVGMADDGYVLEHRLFDAGTNPFSWNVDRATMTPKYMFDAQKIGLKALRAEDIGNPAKPMAIVREANAVAYNADAGWKEGDILPGRLLSRTDAKGSAADNDLVKATWKDGTYTLLWGRKLDTGHPQDDKILKVGQVYTIGLAVHDDNVTGRFHFVGFPLSLGIGAKADIEAVKVN